MIFQRFHVIRQNKSGIILIVVLWILVILSLLAMGIGAKARVESALASHFLRRVQAKWLAWAGYHYALHHIATDSQDPDGKGEDLLRQCGFVLKEAEAAEDLFAQYSLLEGRFDVTFAIPTEDGTVVERYGLGDEDGKINLNTLTVFNYRLLGDLIKEFGYDDSTAETIASAVIDWTDEDEVVFNPPYGAEKDDYDVPGSLPCQNRPFAAKEELLFVRGMTTEIYEQIAPFITVFPRQGAFRVNLDTASATVLRALAASVSGESNNTTKDDADSLVQKILDFRRGFDGADGTDDDRKIDMNEIPLNAKEKLLMLLLLKMRTEVSQSLRFTVRGTLEDSPVSSAVQVVVARDGLDVLSWQDVSLSGAGGL